ENSGCWNMRCQPTRSSNCRYLALLYRLRPSSGLYGGGENLMPRRLATAKRRSSDVSGLLLMSFTLRAPPPLGPAWNGRYVAVPAGLPESQLDLTADCLRRVAPLNLANPRDLPVVPVLDLLPDHIADHGNDQVECERECEDVQHR